MLVSQYISKDFVPAKVNQTVGYGLDLVERWEISHLPLFRGLEFVGNLATEVLKNYDSETLFSEMEEEWEFFYINEKNSILDAIRLFNQYSANILVVLDEEHRFVGFLTIEDLIAALATMPFILESGSVVIIETLQKQFSVSEIAKIAESNNAKITGMFISEYKEDKIQVTLKVVADDLISLVETFERFNYNVLHKFFQDKNDDLIKDRFDLLMKYLDV